jgi:glutathione S-transferase
MITLYCSANTPPFINPEWVRDLRGLWAAEECGVPYQIHWLDTSKGAQREADYRAINPFGIIPAMTDGAFKLFESAAVVTYLCEKAGQNIPPAGTQERALYNQWCFAALNTVEPPVFQHMIAAVLSKDAAWAQERAPQLREGALNRLTVLDGALKARAYLLGDVFSGADILMGHVLNFVADPALFDAVKNVNAYHARLKARPAYVRALAAQAGGRNAAVAAQ